MYIYIVNGQGCFILFVLILRLKCYYLFSDELFFKVDDAITDEPLFVLASQNLYLVPSLVGNKSLNEVISAKKQSQKFGLSLFERHFQPEEIQFALCITSSTPPKCVRVKQSSQHHKLLSVPVMINALCFVNFKTSFVE